QDDDVLGEDRLETRTAAIRLPQEPDAHLLDAGVDVRIVNDLADQIDGAVGKFSAGLVGVLDGAVHPVAETELAGEEERERAGPQTMLRGLETLHDAAVIVGLELRPDLVFQAESALK